jgi:hypothetical protein
MFAGKARAYPSEAPGLTRKHQTREKACHGLTLQLIIILSVANKPIMLGVIMPNVIMPNVIMMSVVMLNVVAPFYSYNIESVGATINAHFDKT